MPTPTLTLQLIFDPTDPICVTFGRFSKDNPGAPTSQRSKVWILDTGNGTPIVQRDKNASVTVLSANPNTPLIQISVICCNDQQPVAGQLPAGWAWATGPGGYSMRITAVFGRAHHAAQRDQTYASPFSVGNQNSASVATVFDHHCSNIAGNQCLLVLGNARFYSTPPLLTAISPTSYASQSGGIGFVITGQNLTGATLQWSQGVTASDVTVTPTQITGTLSLVYVSTTTAGSVSAVVDGETSNPLSFSIQPGSGSDEASAEGNAASGGGNSPTANDIYEFNVGVTAYLSYNQGSTQTFMFGHDPDMDVSV